MAVGVSGIPSAPGAKGSSRLVDIQSFPAVQTGAPGPGGGSDVGRLAPKALMQNVFAADAFGGMSGMNIRDGRIFKYVAATSFNFGAPSGYIVPIVGRKPTRPQVNAPEIQDYWAYEFMLGFGSGDDQGGHQQVNPDPQLGYIGVATDCGVFFYPSDSSLSLSGLGLFTDLSGAGGMCGVGLFMGNDGKVHYGVRKVRSGSATPLDVDIVLPLGNTAQGWPAADYLDFVRVLVEWFAPKNKQPGQFKLTLGNNPPLVNTTIADIGVPASGSGLNTQFPSCYGNDAGQSTETYGIGYVIRGGPGTNNGNASGTMTTAGDTPPGSNSVTLAITSPGGDFAPGDKLTIAGQHFQVTGTVLIPAAASVVIPIAPNTGADIPDGTSVTYAQTPQTFPVAMAGMHLVAGPDLDTTHL